MIKFGIIGTNWITQQFVDAAHETKRWQLNSVYSRTVTKAQEFGEPNYATEYFDNLEDFFNQGNFQAVYIASPNSLHFEQALQAIEADKAVIVEKPIVVNPHEWERLVEALKQHPQAQLFEAARQIHEPNFKVVADQVNQMELIQGATLTYMKYSSRYDAVLAGNTPNIFSTRFAGGATQDLGVYVAYDAVGWFGMPEEVAFYPHKIRTGVDGMGVAILRYPEFDVTLNFGKISNSYLPSEIYGLKDTIVMDNAAELNKVTYYDSEEQAHLISSTPDQNPMVAEANDFADVIEHPAENKAKYEEWLTMSRNVNKLLFNLRQNGKIYFDSEK